jgi:hypothetical protein
MKPDAYKTDINECYKSYSDNNLKQLVVSKFLIYYFDRTAFNLDQFAYALSHIPKKNIAKFFNLEANDQYYYEYPYTPTPAEMNTIYESCISFIRVKNGLKLKLTLEIPLF